MNRFLKSALPVAVAVAAAFGTVAFAGGGAECHKDEAAKAANTAHAKKCSMSAEGCKKEMAEARNRGWMGVELDEAENGTMTVKTVVADSPAMAAGFREGDVLLALNGVTLSEANHDKLKAIRKDLKPGDTVTYTVKRADGEARLSPVLAKMPEKVYQAWVGEHMKEHEEVASR